jgi:hypothetical protein
MKFWVAYFDPRGANTIDDFFENTQGLRLVSVEKDISSFEGKCVLVLTLPSADLDEAHRTFVNMYEDAGEYGLHEFELKECLCPYD